MANKNVCAYWDCKVGIRANHVVCRDHWDDYSDDMFDERSNFPNEQNEIPECDIHHRRPNEVVSIKDVFRYRDRNTVARTTRQ